MCITLGEDLNKLRQFMKGTRIYLNFLTLIRDIKLYYIKGQGKERQSIKR